MLISIHVCVLRPEKETNLSVDVVLNSGHQPSRDSRVFNIIARTNLSPIHRGWSESILNDRPSSVNSFSGAVVDGERKQTQSTTLFNSFEHAKRIQTLDVEFRTILSYIIGHLM